MAALNAAPIRAAGGVVWQGPSPARVCLVHRPRYDDWSLPKGKLEKGEHPLAAAIREVCEEAGVIASPQARLPQVRYVSRGSPKTVDYWSMRAEEVAAFAPNDEVNGVRWLPVAEAIDLASYAHDRDVLRAFGELPPVTGVVLLVRHAHAGKRESWPGEDAARPLEPLGEAEADRLAALLAACRPGRLVSAPPRRCLQTLAPLAAELDAPIEADGRFDETTYERDPDAAATALLAVASLAGTVVCSQGKVIPPTLARLVDAAGGPRRAVEEYHTAKGTGWLLAFSGDRLAALDPLDADPAGVPQRWSPRW